MCVCVCVCVCVCLCVCVCVFNERKLHILKIIRPLVNLVLYVLFHVTIFTRVSDFILIYSRLIMIRTGLLVYKLMIFR